MPVTLIRHKDGKTFANLEKFTRNYGNPWDIAEISDYLNYCCPECDFKSKQDFLFRDHMKENHKIYNSRKRQKIHPEFLIRKFLEEDASFFEQDLGFPKGLEAIKNPPLLLQNKSYEDHTSPPKFSHQNETKFLVSIFKVQEESGNQKSLKSVQDDFKDTSEDVPELDDIFDQGKNEWILLILNSISV